MLWQISVQKKLIGVNHGFEIAIDFQSNSQKIVLFGVSGAGKSQLLRMLTGLVKPDSGYIVFNNQTLFDSTKKINLSPQQRNMTYLFQDYALFPHLTVLQNISFSLNKSWLNRRKNFTNDVVDSWLSKFELIHLVNQYPHQLSGGQAQRVALARALVSQPKALLLDEPFAALDEKLRISLRQQIIQLQTELSLPMILISHSADDVDDFADEVIKLDSGKIID